MAASSQTCHPGLAESVFEYNPWLNPERVYVEDGSEAIGTFWHDIDVGLRLSNFGFTIPPHATIVGLGFRYKRRATLTGDRLFIAMLYLGDTPFAGSEHTDTLIGPTLYWRTLGDDSDLWNAALTPAIVNDPTFKVMYHCTANPVDPADIAIDAAELIVYYTLPITSAGSQKEKTMLPPEMQGRKISVAAGHVDSGNTTATVEVAAAGGTGVKNRVYLDMLSLGAAGNVVVASAATPLLPKIQFAAKGAMFIGAAVEGAANEAINLLATLDAAPAADVPCEAGYIADLR